MEGEAYGAGTVINALATGYGCAFGVRIRTRVKLSVEEDLKKSVLSDGVSEREDDLVDSILSKFGLKGFVEVKSEIPKGSGLGSSSAFVNALLLAIYKHLDKRLFAHEILRTNAKLSLEHGISYTGAFDDASASLLGGIVLTDNFGMKVISWEFRKAKAVILIPEWDRGNISIEEIRKGVGLVKEAVECAMRGDYKNAMILNSKHYCARIGYPFEVVERVKDLDCCAGLSGNGPTFVAFGDGEVLRDVAGIWSEYGKVVWSELVREPSDEVIISRELYGNSKNS